MTFFYMNILQKDFFFFNKLIKKKRYAMPFLLLLNSETNSMYSVDI